jgi:beta-carotene 3-hydroxylase
MNAASLAGLALGFFGMEAFSVLVHRHLFHGPLWFIHRSHHVARRHPWELNDVFSLVFAGAALALIFSAPEPRPTHFRFWVGAGIALYGTIYFVAHDLFTHRRFHPFETRNRWLNHLRARHRRHHQSSAKPGQPPFGLLWTGDAPALSPRDRSSGSPPGEPTPPSPSI